MSVALVSARRKRLKLLVRLLSEISKKSAREREIAALSGAWLREQDQRKIDANVSVKRDHKTKRNEPKSKQRNQRRWNELERSIALNLSFV